MTKYLPLACGGVVEGGVVEGGVVEGGVVVPAEGSVVGPEERSQVKIVNVEAKENPINRKGSKEQQT